jgi:tetratricopeptide (TPR) repeat protein
MKLQRVLASALFLLTAAAPAARASEAGNATLVNAQGLYEQAAYEQALTLLDGLDPKASASLDEGQTIRRYRALCLMALGRSDDARRAIEDMVRADPAAGVDEELPPRLQGLVTEVRAGVVRDLVRQGYERGRDLYGRQEYAGAAAEFTRVIALLDDRTLELTKEPSLADMRLLADGFLRLSNAAPPATSVPGSTPVVESPPAPQAVVQNEPGRSSGAAFVPPVPIVQDVPPFPRSAGAGFMARDEGDLDVDVGADGRVVAARVVSPIHPVYDLMLAAAAKTWKYQPARRNGEPVPYTKRVHIVLQPK